VRRLGRGLGPDRDQRHVMGDHVMQFPRDPGAFLQHGPLRPLGLDALGLGVQGRWERSREPTLSTATATAVKTKGGAGRAVQVRHVCGQPHHPG